MPFNLIKKYPDLLEIVHHREKDRIDLLKKIFVRDIEDNPNFKFRCKTIHPIKGEEPEVQVTFRHLTTEEIEETDENGNKFPKRIFEMERSVRLHWIKYHIEENKKKNVEVFSIEERDKKKRKNIIRTYIYDIDQKYIIVLEPQRSSQDYYILTAYFLNRSYSEEMIKKKMKKKLPVVH